MENTKETKGELLLTESEAIKFWNDVNSNGKPNEALKKAKKTAKKLLKRKDD